MRRLILLAVFLAACDLPPDPRKDPPNPKAVFTLVSVDGRPVPIRCDWTTRGMFTSAELRWMRTGP